MKLRTLIAVGLAAAAMVMVPGTSASAAPARPAPVRPETIHGKPLTLIGTVRIQMPAAGVTPNAGSRVSTFDFANTNIAHFHGTLTYLSRYEFQISNVSLADTLCDNRSVLALVQDQLDGYVQSTYGGQPYTYINQQGCNHTQTGYRVKTFEGTGPGVQFVIVALYAANQTSNSSVVYSQVHSNPYF